MVVKPASHYLAVLCFTAALALPAWAGETPTAPARGYAYLTTKAYLPPDFDQATFDSTWQVWEKPARSQAEKATGDERRAMAFARYGLTSLPGQPGKPHQYVVDSAGNWTMNCLACHQGKVAGRVIPGAPNSLFALETLTEDIRQAKARLGKKPTRMEIGSLFMPLGTSIGTTNAVNFGVALMARRDAQLNVLPLAMPPRMVHHDHDAPAWWLLKKKRYIYSDAFAEKGHRALMQFLLIKENGPERFRKWEKDYADILAWIESLEAPRYPFEVDAGLAAKGEHTFTLSCARCHGTYGEHPTYPEKVVPIDEVDTDRTRLEALSRVHREAYAKSWFADFGAQKTIAEPVGYLAPPLDGIWASAPYFHNGSVPTLWHVLYPDVRPAVWLRSEDGYDQQRVGLEVQALDSVPADLSPAEKRRYFNSHVRGKSASGHPFADELDDAEKQALLEYLKTL